MFKAEQAISQSINMPSLVFSFFFPSSVILLKGETTLMDTWRRKCRNNFTCQLKKKRNLFLLQSAHIWQAAVILVLQLLTHSSCQDNRKILGFVVIQKTYPWTHSGERNREGGKTLLSEKGVSDQQEHLDKNEGSQIETIAVCTLTGENNCKSQRQNNYKMKPTN